MPFWTYIQNSTIWESQQIRRASQVLYSDPTSAQMGKMASYSKGRITYNKVRLSLFLRSYGAYTILNRFKNKPNYRIVSRLSNVLNLDINLLNKFFSSGAYPRGLPNLNRLTKYLVPKEKMLVYLEVEREINKILW